MSRLMKSTLALTALAALTAPGAPAAAATNPKVNVQVFRPAAHEKDLFTVFGTRIPDHLRWTASAMLNFGKNPLVFVDQSTGTNRRDEVIRNRLTLDLMGTIALYDWVDVGLAIPVHLLNSGQAGGFAAPSQPVPSFALGDLRLTPKLKILNRKDDDADGLGVAFLFELDLPTGAPNGFVSDGFSFVPTALVDFKMGPAYVAANLGARVRGTEDVLFLEVSHEFLWRLGASYDVLPEQLQVVGELYGATSDFGRNASYMEGMLGGRLSLPDDGWTVTLGGGSGFLKGYGNTKFRLFAGVGYATPIIKDQDMDGILDDVDKCPLEPEDFDGFEDEDGCPEADNDKDGVPDVSDRCPMDPEDKDNYKDDDGCPDLDNDGDGIADTEDKCPLEAEDDDGFEDKDGCPDPDNDKDGIEDAKDKCPLQPETRNGFEDDDGCPDKTLAKIEKGKITIADKIYFDTGKATIKPESFPVVDAVVGILKANPQVKKIRIEGHTDDRGSARKNLKLSQARADSVKAYLVEHGVGTERLTAVGYGEDRPAVPGTTKEARDANRRVEFIILDQ